MGKEKTFYIKENNRGRIIKTARPEHWQGECYTPLSNKEGVALYQEQCKATLRKMLPKDGKVYTILRNVSQSGMSRQIQCVIVNDGNIQDITYLISQVTGYGLNKAGYLTVGGAYDLSDALHGDGYAISQSWL